MNPKQLQTFLDQCDELSEGESMTITADADGAYCASAWLCGDSDIADEFHSGHGYTVGDALDDLYENIAANNPRR